MSDIKENLHTVLDQIKEAALEANRDPSGIRLVAVSKFHPAQAVEEAMDWGQNLFGENRIQEASKKFDKIRAEGKNPCLHIIGSLQRNKVKEAVRIASCIESVDRLELLEEIEKQCAKIHKSIDVLFELHTGEESKAGFADYASMEVAAEKLSQGLFPHVTVKGLMTMAPNTDDLQAIRNSFVTCRECAQKLSESFPALDFSELSMGMSADFKIAIEEGATLVRIGTAIFGERNYSA